MVAFTPVLWFPGRREGLPPELQGKREHGPGAADPAADGVRHRGGTPASAQTQLHPQVAAHNITAAGEAGTRELHGHFLKQYPGAARVRLTDSSISDFVAGGGHASVPGPPKTQELV